MVQPVQPFLCFVFVPVMTETNESREKLLMRSLIIQAFLVKFQDT